MEKRAHLKAPTSSLNTSCFILFSHFIFYIHAGRPSGTPAVLSARTRSGSPVSPFMICRDDMNVSRPRSDLWMQRPPQLEYCRKHLAAGFLQIPPNSDLKVGGLRLGAAHYSQEPKYGLTNADDVTATLFKAMLQKC